MQLAPPSSSGVQRRRSSVPGRAVLTVSALVFIALALSRAWVGEDAFITFRTLQNFVGGDGLRWNLDERVQTYTHPLWLLVHAPVYALTSEIITTTTTLALLCSLAAWLVVGRRYISTPAALAVGLCLPLLLSPSYLRYATSGFENPLTHLCYALFATSFLASREDREPGWARLVLYTSLGVLTRPDSALIAAPALLLLAWERRRELRPGRIAMGASPLLAWLGFSLLYYGAFLPNTRLAKLNPEIGLLPHLHQGWLYLLDLVRADPVALLMLGAGAGLTLVNLRRALRAHDAAAAGRTGLGAGMLLYLAYVLAIGGGFLSGRFWTLPLLAATILVADELQRAARSLPARFAHRAMAAVAIVLVFAGGVRLWRPPRETHNHILQQPRSRLFLDANLRWRSSWMAQVFARRGGMIRERALEGGAGWPVTVGSTVGIAGIAAGRDVLIIDRFALTDPLLARLSPQDLRTGMMGHFAREIPAGYLEARRTGSLEAMHPSLRAYYEPLRLIVSGPLFDPERLRTLAAFHLGRYDHHLWAYEWAMAVRAKTIRARPDE